MSTTNDDLDNDLNTDENSKPSQLKFLRPAHLMMFANVLCDPPLGQTTVIPFQQRSVCLSSCQGCKQPRWRPNFRLTLRMLGHFHGPARVKPIVSAASMGRGTLA